MGKGRHRHAGRVLACGLVLCALAVVGCASTAPRPAAASAAEARPAASAPVLAQVNRERARVGAAPLRSDPALGRYALSLSLSALDSAARVERPDAVGGGLVLEVSELGTGVEAILDRMLSQASTRSKLMNGDATHVGVGVAAGGDRIGLSLVVARLAPTADVERAPARLLARFDEGRRARGVAPLEADPALQRSAAHAAARFVSQGAPGEVQLVQGVHDELSRLSLAYARVEATVAVVSTVEEASRLEPVFDPDATAVGIGVAQGSRPDYGARVVVVVVVLGWPR